MNKKLLFSVILSLSLIGCAFNKPIINSISNGSSYSQKVEKLEKENKELKEKIEKNKKDYKKSKSTTRKIWFIFGAIVGGFLVNKFNSFFKSSAISTTYNKIIKKIKSFFIKIINLFKKEKTESGSGK